MDRFTEISAFDLDRTLIQGNSSARFCRYLYRQGVLPFSTVVQSILYSLRHRFLGMTLADLHHNAFNKLLRGKPLEMLEKYVDKFVPEYMEKALYMPAVLRLRRAQQQGHYTMILSNSPSFLVKRFAKILGVNAYHATEYAIDENHCFQKIKKILDGKDKAKIIRNMAKKMGIFFEKITTHSDSKDDLEFLKEAGNPIAVNPDKKLRAISVKNEWRII
ncbi:MAG: putative hydrolase [Chlamydiae bacterium]|nr:putative hydrolase [Chlamydiota bacterium]